jgi:iron complex transport system ATP-binding protein
MGGSAGASHRCNPPDGSGTPLTTPRLECTGLRFRYGGPDVLHDVALAAGSGEVVGLVGPNGSGKSTLLQILAGLLAPDEGQVRIDGQPLPHLDRPAIARQLAFVPQQFELAFPFTALEVVLSGRHPHLSWLAFEGREDLAIARAVMARVGLDDLADRRFHELSGGERQRTMIAAALAQQPSVLLLDEPTASLDLHFQEEVMAVIDRTASEGTAVVMAIHDLNLALAWCPRVVVLDGGRVAADGPADQVLTPDRLREVYGTGARMVSVDGRPVVLPSGPDRRGAERGDGG